MLKYGLMSMLFLLIYCDQVCSQCYPLRHHTTLQSHWIGCEPTLSPNLNRGSGIWILYDLGKVHALNASHFWNVNHPEYLELGTSKIGIDVSNDGQNWEYVTDFSLQAAQASGFYMGELGPHFGGVQAQFILLTLLDNHGTGPCRGLGEILIEAEGVVSSVQSETDSFVHIFPNPTADFLNVGCSPDMSGNQAFIYNELGQEVWKGFLNNQKQISTREWSDGLYLFVAHTNINVRKTFVVINP